MVEIPDTVHYGEHVYRDENIPEAFAQYFKTKVHDIAESTKIDESIFNGTRQINSNNEFFMTEIKVREVLSTLKIKNCEGADRLPLRILNEGAEILNKPLSRLFKLIYRQSPMFSLVTKNILYEY